MPRKYSPGLLGALLTSILLLGFLSGCAAPLRIEYYPAQKGNEDNAANSIAMVVKPFKDRRPSVLKDGADPHDIGSIKATTQDIYSKRVVLEESPSSIVTESFKKYLLANGYNVIEAGSAGPSFSGLILSGEIREFRLEIGSKDRIEIKIYSEFRGKDGSAVLWSGLTGEKDSRYAGVFGESRRGVSRYVSATLTKVFAKTMRKARPGLEQIGAPGEKKREKKGEGQGETGSLIVRTVPERAKVFLNGVYYGLSPLRLKLKPGVHELLIRKDGFQDFSEKVAVDRGRETEVEERLRSDPRK